MSKKNFKPIIQDLDDKKQEFYKQIISSKSLINLPYELFLVLLQC